MPARSNAIARHESNRAVVFWVARRLQSANRFHGRQWWAKKAEGDFWEEAFRGALGFRREAFDGGAGRARLEIARLVPSERNYIRDVDNLWFATKPIPDALKRLGLIRDDSMRWLERPQPEQRVSPDGLDWTWVRLTAMEG
jgi:hypothetical protein